jgi:Phosphodiesterase/alkaline phosphatase D
MVGPAHVPAAPAFSYGVAAAEITTTSAILWTRAPHTGTVVLELGKLRIRVPARKADDQTVRVDVKRLKPGTGYTYRFRQGSAVSRGGRFHTAPAASSTAAVDFSFSGDADASRTPGASTPFFNNFEVYGAMAADRSDFAVNFGDTIYSDTTVSKRPPALTVSQKWAMYRENLAMPTLQTLRAATGVYNHWDDHEFRNDFSRAEHGEALYAAGRKAFLDYMPAHYTSQSGLYRTVRWGKNLELFFLDQRSFRSAKADAGGVCDNPPGTPDLAPTAPQPVRDAFAALIPALAKPTAQACLDVINDPKRTFLGAAQLARFENDVRSSSATWKVILSEDPIQQFYALPYDRWEGYAAERRTLLQFLQANVKNAVFLTTDTHANFYNEVRLQTLEAGGPIGTGIYEMVTGPVATFTFAKEIDAAVGSPGTGSLITALFLKPQPPKGIGMQCAATDVFSYVHVRVTSTTLTFIPRDGSGQPVTEAGNQPCGPFTLQAH